MKPPLQPLFLYFSVEQSTRFCALRDTRLPVFSFSCASRAPTALKAQQAPQEPWNRESHKGSQRVRKDFLNTNMSALAVVTGTAPRTAVSLLPRHGPRDKRLDWPLSKVHCWERFANGGAQSIIKCTKKKYLLSVYQIPAIFTCVWGKFGSYSTVILRAAQIFSWPKIPFLLSNEAWKYKVKCFQTFLAS